MPCLPPYSRPWRRAGFPTPPSTAKALQLRSGLPLVTFKRELAVLYQAFIVALETQPNFLHFSHPEHYLVVGGRRAPLAIRCRLPATPQLGEGIELGFVSGFTGRETD